MLKLEFSIIKKLQSWTENPSYYVVVLAVILYWLLVAVASTDIHGSVRLFTTRTNSMNPIIDSGSLVMVKKQPEHVYGEGDIISFYAQENGKEIIVTHRIVQIGGNVYVTKGDANEAIDELIVKPRLVIGKVIGVIPYVGYVLNFSKTIYGTIFTIFIPLLFILFAEGRKIYSLLSKQDEPTV